MIADGGHTASVRPPDHRERRPAGWSPRRGRARRRRDCISLTSPLQPDAGSSARCSLAMGGDRRTRRTARARKPRRSPAQHWPRAAPAPRGTKPRAAPSPAQHQAPRGTKPRAAPSPAQHRPRAAPSPAQHWSRAAPRPAHDEAPQTETGLRGFVVSRVRQAVRAAGVRLRVVSTWSTMPYSIASAAERILSRSMSLLTLATS